MEREKYKANKSKLLTGDKDQQQLLFEKYGIHYTAENVRETEERNQLFDRQRYLFDGLCDKGVKHTNIEKVLDIAIGELHQQETIKQNIEFKVSFVMAFLGILRNANRMEGMGVVRKLINIELQEKNYLKRRLYS